MFTKHNTTLKIILYSLILFALYIIQSVPALGLRFMDISPELLLVLTISIAFHESETFAAFFGLAAGVLNDIVTDGTVGKTAVFFMFAAFIISVLLQTLLRHFFLTYIFIVLSTTAIFLLGSYLFNLLFIGYIPLGTALLHVILPKFFFTGVLSYPMYFAIRFIHKKLDDGGEAV